jgi:hypothetical protein
MTCRYSYKSSPKIVSLTKGADEGYCLYVRDAVYFYRLFNDDFIIETMWLQMV